MRLIPALASLLLVALAAPGLAQNIQTQGNQSSVIDVGDSITLNYANMTSEEKAAFVKQVGNTLLEATGKKGGSVVGPGADQQVGQAVTAIAQGAREGDRRLQKAMNLLAIGDVEQATPLLQAFADEKTVSISGDRKEAGTA